MEAVFLRTFFWLRCFFSRKNDCAFSVLPFSSLSRFGSEEIWDPKTDLGLLRTDNQTASFSGTEKLLYRFCLFRRIARSDLRHWTESNGENFFQEKNPTSLFLFLFSSSHFFVKNEFTGACNFSWKKGAAERKVLLEGPFEFRLSTESMEDAATRFLVSYWEHVLVSTREEKIAALQGGGGAGEGRGKSFLVGIAVAAVAAVVLSVVILKRNPKDVIMIPSKK